jgi:hypothetical protein
MRARTVIALVVVGGAGYWIYRSQLTVSEFVDDLTRPLMGSKAAVKESEYKRVISLAVPAAHEGEQISTQTVREGMKTIEVEELLGKPERVEPFEEDGHSRVRWVYERDGRIIVFERGRVFSIAIR